MARKIITKDPISNLLTERHQKTHDWHFPLDMMQLSMAVIMKNPTQPSDIEHKKVSENISKNGAIKLKPNFNGVLKLTDTE